MTPSLVRCILTAQSLCCSLYSHRFARHKLPASGLVGGKNFLYLYTEPPTSATTLFGGKFVWRKSVMCLCTEPPTSVTSVFGGKHRRRHKWSHGSDAVESPLIPLVETPIQFMSCSVETSLCGGFRRPKVRLFCSTDTESVLGAIHFSSTPSANTFLHGNLHRRKTTSSNSTVVLETLI